MKKEFIKFSLVGVAGFLVDAGSFQLFLLLIENHYIARLGSYIVAATATWLLNRTFTFRHLNSNSGFRAIIVEWFTFLSSQTLGFALNYGVFSLLVATTAFFYNYPIFAIGFGSIAGLSVNFLVARNLVFKGSKKDEA